jgi:hypothetical protein
MLYTTFIMNNKLNVPEEVIPGKDYSFWADMKVNGWPVVAALIWGASDVLFPHMVRLWPIGWRVAIAVAPFLIIPLWVRDVTRWIRGMDELHQRITLAAILFAVSTTLFFVVLWHRLDKVGVFQAILPTSKNPDVRWDICTFGHSALLLALFYFLGYAIFNRRYK